MRNIRLMSIFQFVELRVRFDSDTSLWRPTPGLSTVQCRVEIRLAAATPRQGLKSNLDLLLHSYNDSSSARTVRLFVTLCLSDRSGWDPEIVPSFPFLFDIREKEGKIRSLEEGGINTGADCKGGVVLESRQQKYQSFSVLKWKVCVDA